MTMHPLILLVNLAFDFYIFIVLMRILLQWLGADYYNPLSQFIVKLTQPLLAPLRRRLPTLHGFDIAAIVVLLALEVIKLGLMVWFADQLIADLIGLLMWGFADIASQVLDIFFYAILAIAILSWFNPRTTSPLVAILHALTTPLLQPLRKIIPTVANIDLTPLIALALLKLISLMVVHPLLAIGISRVALAAHGG